VGDDDTGDVVPEALVDTDGEPLQVLQRHREAADAEDVLGFDRDPGRQRQIADQFLPAGPCHGRTGLVRAGRDGAPVARTATVLTSAAPRWGRLSAVRFRCGPM
jgi:hypothetical protein